MNENQEVLFRNEFFGVYFNSIEEIQMLEWVDSYHELTEAYDKSVCSISINGRILPKDSFESGLINRNARQTENWIWKNYIEPLGLSRYEWQRALSAGAHRMEQRLRVNYE